MTLSTLRSASLGVAAVLVVLGACGPPRVENAWGRVDLTAVTPEEAPEGLAVVPVPLGRSPARVPAGQILALSIPDGATASWEIEVGRDSYLFFVPLGSGGDDDPVTYRVTVVGPEDEVHEALAESVASPSPWAPEPVVVDLAPWEGRRVELGLRSEGGVGLWARPTVYGRRSEPVIGSRDHSRPNVLLVGADTLRADALGAWGRSPSVTPALDRLAAESELWENAFASANSTNPSFASLLTGLYAKDHGIYDLVTPLPEEHVTFPELLADAGYLTLAVISASHLGSRLDQGFDHLVAPETHFAAGEAVELALSWLDGVREPFFLWLHLFDPHTPHTAPLPFADGLVPASPSGLRPPPAWDRYRPPGPDAYADPALGGHRDLYASEVAYLDRQVDRLLDFLESRDALGNTIVVFVSDHGENLEDHGVRYRHAGLWDTTVHVPMMVRWPGGERAGTVQSGLVQHLDLFPTLLDALGIRAGDRDGVSLRRLAASGGRPMVFAEHSDRHGAMVRTPRYKYVEITGGRFVDPGAFVYDLEADPGETVDLAGQGLAVEEDLRRALHRWLADRRDMPTPESAEVDPEERRRLEALGYM